ncbi:50S ribosomal protein L29 [Desulfovibrio inopinatus]|uniref:50S ribosomal protein L29 n=1 Tax=Desulfovibrio inopinatus TaxID=102109 RepID=UPI0003F9923C|nr:50S ribosomal protein L29 [Desulfovibrio inopinatus]
MQMSEMRELDAQKLTEELAKNREELFKLRFQHATAQLEKTHRIPEVKKNIARILTVLKEKESGRES